MSKYKILWTADENNRRDYRDRQLYANEKGAVAFIQGHYNAKEYDKPGTQDNPALVVVADNSGSKTRSMGEYFAKRISDTFGFPNGGVHVRKQGERGYWNVYYAKGNSMLLEPFYVSDPEQALLAQSEDAQDKIAGIIADMCRMNYPDGSLLAFDIGHKYKVSSPYDRGAPVVGTKGLGEADLVELYMRKAAVLLETPVTTETDSIAPPTSREAPLELTSVEFPKNTRVQLRLEGRWTVLQHTEAYMSLAKVCD